MTSSPNPIFLDGQTPTVTLAGVQWPIPPLTPKQNRIVTPTILRLLPRLASVAMDSSGNADPLKVITSLDEELYNGLITAVFWSVKRAHPTITIDEFENMPITTEELVKALFPVIATQAGLIKKTEDKQSPLETMEAQQSLQIGIE